MSRRRDGARNFFPMPQKIFNLGMNAGEIAVYAYLMFRENRKTYQCYPSYRTIGEAVGLSRNAVKNKVDSLVEKQLIYTEPTTVKLKDGRTRNGNLLYTIRPLDAAK
jgi:predicted transcriptional regulator